MNATLLRRSRNSILGAWLTPVTLAILLLAPAPSAHAQSSEGHKRQASFTAGASLGDGRTALALSAGLGFRFASRVGIDVEAAYARKLDFTFDVCPAPLVCVLGGEIPVTGRTVALVPHLAIELVPVSRNLRVYAQAGIGAAHVRQRYFYGPPYAGDLTERTRSNLTLAVGFGGGVTVRVAPRVDVGVDVRSLHLFDDDATTGSFITPSGALSTLRIGSRVGWRF